jgi:hypothetical protein
MSAVSSCALVPRSSFCKRPCAAPLCFAPSPAKKTACPPCSFSCQKSCLPALLLAVLPLPHHPHRSPPDASSSPSACCLAVYLSILPLSRRPPTALSSAPCLAVLVVLAVSPSGAVCCLVVRLAILPMSRRPPAALSSVLPRRPRRPRRPPRRPPAVSPSFCSFLCQKDLFVRCELRLYNNSVMLCGPCAVLCTMCCVAVPVMLLCCVWRCCEAVAVRCGKLRCG